MAIESFCQLHRSVSTPGPRRPYRFQAHWPIYDKISLRASYPSHASEPYTWSHDAPACCVRGEHYSDEALDGLRNSRGSYIFLTLLDEHVHLFYVTVLRIRATNLDKE